MKPVPKVIRVGRIPYRVIHHHYHATQKGNGELAIVLLLTVLFWPFGLVATAVYLLAGRFGNFLLLLVLTAIMWALTHELWAHLLASR
jgi:hypothetical protein